MALFSERHGHKPVRDSLQFEFVDADLRNGLWNALLVAYWSTAEPHRGPTIGGPACYLSENEQLACLCTRIWRNLFKEPLDTLSDDWGAVCNQLRKHFFSATWHEVYDFVEFVANNYPVEPINAQFVQECNEILEREMAGYRFIDRRITPIIDDVEVATIEAASQADIPQVQVHLNRAVDLLSDRQDPDYRNSIKESISAVEALARRVADDSNATLGQLLNRLEKGHGLHPALRSAFSSLYGYTSNAEGIRHALTEDEETLTFEDAKFMLVACAAFVNYVDSTLGTD